MIDPRRLRFLLAVARYGGVLAAADELAVTASAVSQQIGQARAGDRPHPAPADADGQRAHAGRAGARRGGRGRRAGPRARARPAAPGRGRGDRHGPDRWLPVVPDHGPLAGLAGLARAVTSSCAIETVEAEEAELLRALRAGVLDGVAVELDAARATRAQRGTNDTPLLDEPRKLVVPVGCAASHRRGRLRPAGAALARRRPDRREREGGRPGAVKILGGDELERAHLLQRSRTRWPWSQPARASPWYRPWPSSGCLTDGVDVLDVPGLGIAPDRAAHPQAREAARVRRHGARPDP